MIQFDSYFYIYDRSHHVEERDRAPCSPYYFVTEIGPICAKPAIVT